MRFDNFLIAFVVFSVVVITGVLLIGDLNTNYNLNMSTEDFGEVYNITDSMYNFSQDLQGKTVGDNGTELTDATAEGAVVSGSYSALRLVTSTFSLIGAIINAIAVSLNVPKYFVTAAITCFSITIIVSLIYLFIARSP